MLKFSNKRNQYANTNKTCIVSADKKHAISYNWFYMLRTFKLGKKEIRVFNSCNYSVTTAKHKGDMYRVIGYDNQENDLHVYDNKGLNNISEMIATLENQIKFQLSIINKPRVRQATKEKALKAIENLYKDLQIVKKLKSL